MLKPLRPLAMLLSLAGCLSMQIDNPDSYFYRPPAGSVVQLNQALTVPRHRTRTFMQHGKRVMQLDLYTPHCNFEVRDLKQETQQIEPGRFIVSRIDQGGTPVVQREGWKIAGPAWSLSFGDPPVISRYYYFYLESQEQPNVLRLSCYAGQADAPRAYLPTLQEMQEAMGDLVTIEPAS